MAHQRAVNVRRSTICKASNGLSVPEQAVAMRKGLESMWSRNFLKPLRMACTVMDLKMSSMLCMGGKAKLSLHLSPPN